MTHDRLVHELAVGANAAVVFPDYDRSPEARYPVAIEQSWTVARWIAESGADHDLDPGAVAVAGDSVGGNMAIALTLLAKQRGGVRFAAQVLFYPVTDAASTQPSYERFADGYYLTGRGCGGSGTSTRPTRPSGRRSPRRRCAPASRT